MKETAKKKLSALELSQSSLARASRLKQHLTGPASLLLGGACLFLMLNLQPVTWAAFGIWLVIGLVIYFLYSRHNSKLARGHAD